MKKNMNSADRIVRVLIAAGILVLYFNHIVTGTLAVVLLVLACIVMLTAFIGICPLYSLLGISTSKKDSSNGTT